MSVEKQKSEEQAKLLINKMTVLNDATTVRYYPDVLIKKGYVVVHKLVTKKVDDGKWLEQMDSLSKDKSLGVMKGDEPRTIFTETNKIKVTKDYVADTEKETTTLTRYIVINGEQLVFTDFWNSDLILDVQQRKWWFGNNVKEQYPIISFPYRNIYEFLNFVEPNWRKWAIEQEKVGINVLPQNDRGLALRKLNEAVEIQKINERLKNEVLSLKFDIDQNENELEKRKKEIERLKEFEKGDTESIVELKKTGRTTEELKRFKELEEENQKLRETVTNMTEKTNENLFNANANVGRLNEQNKTLIEDMKVLRKEYELTEKNYVSARDEAIKQLEENAKLKKENESLKPLSDVEIVKLKSLPGELLTANETIQNLKIELANCRTELQKFADEGMPGLEEKDPGSNVKESWEKKFTQSGWGEINKNLLAEKELKVKELNDCLEAKTKIETNLLGKNNELQGRLGLVMTENERLKKSSQETVQNYNDLEERLKNLLKEKQKPIEQSPLAQAMQNLPPASANPNLVMKTQDGPYIFNKRAQMVTMPDGRSYFWCKSGVIEFVDPKSEYAPVKLYKKNLPNKQESNNTEASKYVEEFRAIHSYADTLGYTIEGNSKIVNKTIPTRYAKLRFIGNLLTVELVDGPSRFFFDGKVWKLVATTENKKSETTAEMPVGFDLGILHWLDNGYYWFEEVSFLGMQMLIQGYFHDGQPGLPAGKRRANNESEKIWIGTNSYTVENEKITAGIRGKKMIITL